MHGASSPPIGAKHLDLEVDQPCEALIRTVRMMCASRSAARSRSCCTLNALGVPLCEMSRGWRNVHPHERETPARIQLRCQDQTRSAAAESSRTRNFQRKIQVWAALTDSAQAL